MPRGFRTLDGPNKALAEEFGLREHQSPSYNMRTSANARDSDGTVRFARRFMSAGEKCTLRYIELFNKPHIDVHINRPIDPSEMKKWLEENKIGVLNVAGNSEMTCPGIEKFVTDYLLQVFG